MSCKHGNWHQCDFCDAEEASFESGVEAGRLSLKILLIECEVALGLLSNDKTVQNLRARIAAVFPPVQTGDEQS